MSFWHCLGNKSLQITAYGLKGVFYSFFTELELMVQGEEMKLNKLKKKCVSEFFAQHEGTHKTPEEVGAKFDKKIKKRKYRILKDKVKLIPDEQEEKEEEQEQPLPHQSKARGFV